MSRESRGMTYDIVVCYWSNAGSARKVSGHIACKIHGTGFTGGGKADTCFINWAPRSRRNGGDLRNVLGPLRKTDVIGIGMKGMHDTDRFTYRGDSEAMGEPANEKQLVPAMQETGTFGLDVVAMYDWWRVFAQYNRSGWSMLRRNCSSVVAKALMAGGAEKYVKAPKTAIWTPNAVYNWAKKLADVIDVMVQSGIEMRDDVQARRTDWDDLPLWSVDEFKTRSDLGKFKVRSSEIKKIDAALGRYHAAKTGGLDGGREVAAAALFKAIHEQMASNPDSKRRDAIVALGKQFLRETADLNARAELANRQRVQTLAMAPVEPKETDWGPLDGEGRAMNHDDLLLDDAAYRIYCAERGIM